ncbi:hypothetical protein ACS0TY_027930 [Phlomoides rotata]
MEGLFQRCEFCIRLNRSDALSTVGGHIGYGAEQEKQKLRAAIASTYYADLDIEEDDIFVSDGAKRDISHLQVPSY